jgi:hypothetical protein
MGPWASSIPAHTTPIATKLSPRFPQSFSCRPAPPSQSPLG